MSEQTKRKVFLLSGGREITVYPREKMPAQKTNKQTSNKKKITIAWVLANKPFKTS